jgi:Carboxypeptidase regulatory-like domain/TonB-dependent Receptor Plug Domain
MPKRIAWSIACVALLLWFTGLGFAQASAESAVRGNLAGSVLDPSSALVQGAKVTLSGPMGKRSAETDQEGRFLFQVLVPGFYSVNVEKQGFKSTDVKGVEVVTGRTSSVSVKMEVGASETTVEVTGGAITVDTESTAQASNLTDTFYQSVPMGRGVTGLFYAAPGVASGGGTGTANPSISGATGLENNYIADGVSITDGAFGGIGVYSRVYGSLSSGINLSFVKEVQVKTGGFEAQYGKSTGGIVQIVTKTGSNAFHGSVGGYFAPQQLEATRLQVDDFGLGGSQQHFNLQGKILHQSNYDADAQLGGYVPGLKDHLFFFGSFNPQWNTDYNQFAQYRNPSDLGTGGAAGPTQTHLGNYEVPVRVYSYAGKLTFRLNDHHQFEGSAFGDPTYGDKNANGNAGPQTASKTTFDKLQYGTRNVAARYNGTLTPTWLFNASWAWGHNNLNDTPAFPDTYVVVDRIQRNPCGPPVFSPECTATTNALRGQYVRQGLGYFENTTGDNYGLNFDTQKVFNFLGQHTLGLGYRYDRSYYDGTKLRTGPTIPVDAATALVLAGSTSSPLYTSLVSNGTNASFQLRDGGNCIGDPVPITDISELYVPGMTECPDGGIPTFLRQDRGEFGLLNFNTASRYHTVFAQDAWSPSKYVTINGGLRWEQQHVAGVNARYTFNDNWSPRVGISVDPWGNRKTKITANFGRYTEALPLDAGIRSLSAEYDFPTTNWTTPNDGAGHALINADGTIDFSHFSTANNNPQFFGGVSAQDFSHAFGKGTRSEFLDEYVVGFEHEFGNSGVIFSARYNDRRIKRIIEDNAALSPEAFQNNLGQFYTISNVNKNQDLFKNPVQIDYVQVFDPVTGLPTLTPPAGCTSSGTNTGIVDAQAIDSNGNIVTLSNGGNAFCIPNAFDAAGNQITATYGADGIPDGFVDPVRKYQAVEFEVNKSLSKGWLMRANYRIAKLQGNYEGSFRNDNGQNDPNISSLFDFTQGDFKLLGQQFVPGVLNTDVHHLVNGFVSYTLIGNHMRGLTMGTGVHFQTGIPINNLFAHPAYQNAGEVPFCADDTTNCASARGSLGRTKNWGSVDYHMDYPIRITEGTRLRLAADLFNIANSKTQLRVDQFRQSRFGVGNADFGKPTGIGPSAVNGNTNPGYQRPFYARFAVKFEF